MTEESNQEPQHQTVNDAVRALVADVVTSGDSTLTLLLSAVEDAADRLDRAVEDALAALGPGTCEHDIAPWIADIESIADDLRAARSVARYEASDAVDALRAAIAARTQPAQPEARSD
jgi:tetrahydromethanopterin S-methyltransferase subunit B